MYKHILVPVDGSELSSAAVAGACTFAREMGARLTFYHAKPAYFPPGMSGEFLIDDAAIYAALSQATEHQSKEILNAAAQQAAKEGINAETLSDDSDSPYTGIIAAAEANGCDLIFMASHGRRGASALLLGSETQKVLTHCRIPVLVYR